MSPIPDAIIEELTQKDFIVFAGSGVDSSADIPNWQKLLEELLTIAKNMGFKENIVISPKNQVEYPIIAQNVYNFLDRIGKKEIYFEKIKKIITPRNIPYGTEHLEIVKTTNWIITTNFSDLFEKAFKSKFELTKKEEEIYFESLPNFSHENHFDNPTIIYLHGKADENYIIFKQDDYNVYYPSVSNYINKPKDVEDYLKYVYTHYTLVFIGFGFEYHIRETFKKIYEEIKVSDEYGSAKPNFKPKLNKIKHYCFLKKEKGKEQQQLISILKNINIEVIEMKEYIEWINFFKEIREKRRNSKPLEVGNEI